MRDWLNVCEILPVLRQACQSARCSAGSSFLIDGNMSFGIVGSELMVRVGPDASSGALALPHAREMDFTGRSMRGMVFISEDGISEDNDLEVWLGRGMDFALSLPAN